MTLRKPLTDSEIIFAIVDKQDKYYGANGEITRYRKDGTLSIAIKDILWDTIDNQQYRKDQVLTLKEFRTKQKEWEAVHATGSQTPK